MLAIAFARRDKAAADRIVSQGISMALAFGLSLGLAVYLVAPAALTRVAGQNSAAVVPSALTYVRIRCGLCCCMLHSALA